MQLPTTRLARSENVTAHWLCGATAAEVEVDVETGKVRIVDLATAVDVGKAINPFACRQQISGASVQGIGPALIEEILPERRPGGEPLVRGLQDPLIRRPAWSYASR